MNKKSMPHIDVKDKGTADLYFEFLEPVERREFFEDFKDGSEINLPDFGSVNGVDIENKVKKINEKQVSHKDEEFIQRFLREQKIKSPYLEYEKGDHSYKLKPKYDLERMMKEITMNV